tara:strand:- start:600 stop:830 length:231 start_codon:yes stop_codon:yes gene_type:complete
MKKDVKSPYFTNKKVRKKIDKILEQNASIWANLGTDTPKDLKTRKEGEKQWRALSKEIKTLDEAFYKVICPYGIDS